MLLISIIFMLQFILIIKITQLVNCYYIYELYYPVFFYFY